MIHGGDIYNNKIEYDFSVNVNPLGTPKAVKSAMTEALTHLEEYPEYDHTDLKKAIAKLLGSGACENICITSGASEGLMAIVHALKPKRGILFAPSFYGYEYALKAVGAELTFIDDLSCETVKRLELHASDLVILGNPNNPTGKLIDPDELKEIISYVEQSSAHIVVDECFITLAGEVDKSVINYRNRKSYDCPLNNTLVLRSFTKTYAIPAVRLGYIFSWNSCLIDEISAQLPEWNLSTMAIAAGMACIKESVYVDAAIDMIKKEREFLNESLSSLGLKIYESYVNFILFEGPEDLYERLLDKGILIRDCSNFRGLNKGFYRIAVKDSESNKILVDILGKILKNE